MLRATRDVETSLSSANPAPPRRPFAIQLSSPPRTSGRGLQSHPWRQCGGRRPPWCLKYAARTSPQSL